MSSNFVAPARGAGSIWDFLNRKRIPGVFYADGNEATLPEPEMAGGWPEARAAALPPVREPDPLPPPPPPSRLETLEGRLHTMDNPEPQSWKRKLLNAAISAAPMIAGGIFGGEAGAIGAGEGMHEFNQQRLGMQQKERDTLLDEIENERQREQQAEQVRQNMEMQRNRMDQDRLQWQEEQKVRNASLQEQIRANKAREAAASTPNPPEPFTLGTGQQRYGPDGRLIASGPAPAADAASGFTLSPGQRRYDAAGKLVANAPESAAQSPLLPSSLYAGAAPGVPGERNEDVLKNLPPGIANTIKAMVDGRYPMPTGSALRSPQVMQLLEIAGAYEPGFDASQWKTRLDTRVDFAKGKAAVNIRSLNTLVGHLGDLADAVQRLGNFPVRMINQGRNWVRQQTGSPDLKPWQTASTAVESEFASLLKGTGATDQEIAAQRRIFDMAESPEAQMEAIRSTLHLAFSRMNALKDQYENIFRKPKDFQFLSPEAQRIVRDKLGMEAEIDSEPAGGGRLQRDMSGANASAGSSLAASAAPAVREQRNAATGQYRYSLDGGKTWQPGRAPRR